MTEYWNRRVIFKNSEWINETYVRASNIFQVAETLLEKRAARERLGTVVAIKAPLPEADDLDDESFSLLNEY